MWPFRSRIYLDYASATPVCAEAADAYARALKWYGNPGALHAEGVAAREALTNAREMIARELAIKAHQLVFVSGSTEGNNLCIVGYARKILAQRGTLEGTHWVVSAIEHPSVLEAFSEVERLGGLVSHLDPQSDGRITPDLLNRALKPQTVFVSIGWANSEIGVVQPLRALREAIDTRFAPQQAPLFHSDLGQAPLYKAPQVHTLGLDLAVLGSGKLYGPRGIGAVYVSHRAEIAPLTFGGDQERSLRAGTESVALAAGFAAALEAAGKRRECESRRLSNLRDELRAGLCAAVPALIVNTPHHHALPHLLNVSVLGIASEYVVARFDYLGIAISTKSACQAGELSSHVVAALGGPEDRAKTTLRFSLGLATNSLDIRRTIAVFHQIVQQ